MRIAVIGVGLIGGSIALAARERADATVVGFDEDPRPVQTGVESGALDHSASSIEEAVSGADITFIAVPVGALPNAIAAVLNAAPAESVVTDVGSTKRAIVAAHAGDSRFVGGHPLAGAETAGIEHARADLFEAATWYLTPTETTSGMVLERLYRLLRTIGARPSAIDAETHDTILATVSHLPHVLANVLVSQVAQALGEDERLPGIGPSFRDATRVAGAPSTIWTDIYLSNRDALIPQIDDTIARLGIVRGALAEGKRDAITAWNEDAAAHRRRIVDAQLAGGGDLFELRASVPNRPGVVAQLALELGRAGVNITDMALYPTADMSEGVVALWVSGEDDARRTEDLVGALGFPVARA